MVDYNNAISVIRDNGGFNPNKDDSSFYRTYILQNSKPIQVRLSNHGTHLWTWDKNGEYIPSYAINICVVFMSSSEGFSKPNTSVDMDIKDGNGNVVGRKKDYEIIEYVYDCDKLSIEDCALINKEIVLIPTKGTFSDPFCNHPTKHCSVYRLHPNAEPEIITESKNYKNIKTKKTITESQLKTIVAESLKRVLKEQIDALIPSVLYHATPASNISSIKKYGLGGKITPQKKLWDYDGTDYQNYNQGVFLDSDDECAIDFVACSERFEDMCDDYEEKYEKPLGIAVFAINSSNLDKSLISVDSNNSSETPTYFYKGIIPWGLLKLLRIDY